MFCELTHIHIKVKWGFFDQGQPHAPCGFYRRGNLGLGRGLGRGLGFGLGVGTMITGPPVIIVMFSIFFSLPAFRMALGFWLQALGFFLLLKDVSHCKKLTLNFKKK